METIYSDEDIKLSAKIGAIWMDDNLSNWVSYISLDILEMSHCENCIIGQTIGEFDEVLEDLGYSGNWAVEHGFIAPSQFKENGKYDDVATNKYYHKLEAAWAEEVNSRR